MGITGNDPGGRDNTLRGKKKWYWLEVGNRLFQSSMN